MALRWMLVFVLLLDSTVSCSENTLFVQTGGSVTLYIQTHELPEFDELVWKNEKSENIFKYISATKTARLHPFYTNRTDFNNETFSLTLKNMQKTDSGVYTASTSGDLTKDVAKHRVSVMDPVEAPVLSENICSFTCKGHNFTISSTYNNSCFQEEVRSSGNYTLSLYCSGDFIICNHSNPVSWRNDTKEVNESCIVNKDTSTGPQSEYISWLIPLIVVLALIVAVVVFYSYRNKKGI
ncbi:CD48 antigen-like [Xyrauchen texanus]|uniref:CD48 antigen-like n=1 Tax=Xyrauchen texanus TaxID=154827 RepID=UPI0022422209|nr:CD48 antigen-like [Xyrauchen texanus]